MVEEYRTEPDSDRIGSHNIVFPCKNSPHTSQYKIHLFLIIQRQLSKQHKQGGILLLIIYAKVEALHQPPLSLRVFFPGFLQIHSAKNAHCKKVMRMTQGLPCKRLLNGKEVFLTLGESLAASLIISFRNSRNNAFCPSSSLKIDHLSKIPSLHHSVMQHKAHR